MLWDVFCVSWRIAIVANPFVVASNQCFICNQVVFCYYSCVYLHLSHSHSLSLTHSHSLIPPSCPPVSPLKHQDWNPEYILTGVTTNQRSCGMYMCIWLKMTFLLVCGMQISPHIIQLGEDSRYVVACMVSGYMWKSFFLIVNQLLYIMSWSCNKKVAECACMCRSYNIIA